MAPVSTTKIDQRLPSHRKHILLDPGSKDDFIMADAAIKIVQQGGRLIGDDGGFDVIARKGANRGQRIAIGDHEDLDSVLHFAPQQCSALVPGQFF